jgi:RecA-family ATPase
MDEKARDAAQKQFAAALAGMGEAERSRFLAQTNLLALEQVPEEAFEPPIRTLGQYLTDPIEIPPVLVQPFHLVRGGMNAVIGRSGKGKTVMCLNRCLKWSVGRPLFDDWKDKDDNPHLCPTGNDPLKILVVENEGAAGMFHRQIGIMTHAEGFLTPDEQKLAKENILIWGEGGYSGLKLDDAIKLELLREGVEKWEPDIVFIEPFRSLWSGNENDSTEMAVVVDALIGVASDFKCGVVLAHHERKGGAGEDDKMSAARGSGVLENFVTVMEHFEPVKGDEFRELSWSKSRYEPQPLPVRMSWDKDAWWYTYVPSDDILVEIMDALRLNNDEPMGIKDLQEATEESADKLRRACNQAVKDGKLKKASSEALPGGKGSTGARYRLPSGFNEGTGGLAV